MRGISIIEAEQILAENFADWIHDLNLQIVEISATQATLELPFNERLCRVGGMICGQSLVSAADTSMVIAVCSALGGFKPLGTVDLTSNFMRPILSEDVQLKAKIMRLGRTMAFCNTEISGKESGKQCAFATGTFALPA
ncbi:MAG: PaaI family thioesterase [Hyphomicrobiales bacterium]